MVDVKIAKMCGCVKRNGIPEVQSFENPEDALKSANELAKEMTEKFCKKHIFSVAQNSQDELVIIEVEPTLK